MFLAVGRPKRGMLMGHFITILTFVTLYALEGKKMASVCSEKEAQISFIRIDT